MPVQIASFLLPRNGNTWYLLEDNYVKGGFQIVADLATRDAINPMNRKDGMLVYVQADRSLWQLGADLVTWASVSFAKAYNPFHTHIQQQPASRWAIFHARNCSYFHAQCFDSAGKWLVPNDITIVDANTIHLDFLGPIAGHCTLSFDQLP